MVETETKEGYDDIVEEILRRIIENDLFVKLEKYIWKVRKVRFLEVAIGLDRVKMKKKDSRSSEQTSTKEHERYAEVFGVGKLLQTICQKFH